MVVNVRMRLPEQVTNDLAAVEIRAGSLKKYGARGIAIAGVLAVASAAAYGLAYWLTPSIALSAVDVPKEILNQFSDTISFSGNGGSFESLTGGLVSTLVSFATGMVPLVIWGLFAVFGVVTAVFTGRMQSLVGVATIAVPLLIAPRMMVALFGLGDVAGGESPRAAMERVAKAADIVGLEKLMAGKLAPTMQNYLLSQAIVVSWSKQSDPIDQDTRRALQKSMTPVIKDVVDGVAPYATGKTLYALESNAFGTLQTQISRTYVEEGKTTRELMRFAGTTGSVVALLCALGGGGLFLLGMHLNARVRRIKWLVGGIPDNTKSEPQPQVEVSENVGLDWIPPHKRKSGSKVRQDGADQKGFW